MYNNQKWTKEDSGSLFRLKNEADKLYLSAASNQILTGKCFSFY